MRFDRGAINAYFPLVISMRRSTFPSLSIISLGLLCVLPLVSFADPDDKTKEAAKGDSSAAKSDASSEKNKSRPNAADKNKSAVKGPEFTVEREQSALDFAAKHHPELVTLIEPLKAANPKEYQRAIKELYRTSDRLLGIKLKDPVRHELELDAWKFQSQIRLLTARLTMAPDPDLEVQLRDTLKKKAENQLKLFQNERESLQARLAQVEKQIDRASKSQDQLVQQEYERLLKATGRDKKAAATKANPGKPVTRNKGNAPKGSSTTSAGNKD